MKRVGIDPHYFDLSHIFSGIPFFLENGDASVQVWLSKLGVDFPRNSRSYGVLAGQLTFANYFVITYLSFDL